MAGRPLDESKHRPQGRRARRALVRAAFADAADVIASVRFGARRATVEDTLDAYAVLWSALRIGRGKREVLGGERDGHGLIMRIAY